MTHTHRKTTNRTVARIAAVSAFGIGAAIAVPGIAAAQSDAPDLGSLAGAGLDTDVAIDAGSLSFNLNLDASAPNPGSVELGSLGVSPNTGSGLIDGDSGSALPGSSDEEANEAEGSGSALPGSSEEDANEDDGSGSLDMGSLTGSADDNDTVLTPAADEATNDETDTGSGTFDPATILSGLSSEGTDAEGGAALNLDLLLDLAAGSAGGGTTTTE